MIMELWPLQALGFRDHQPFAAAEEPDGALFTPASHFAARFVPICVTKDLQSGGRRWRATSWPSRYSVVLIGS
jgi:hypothetical protein